MKNLLIVLSFFFCVGNVKVMANSISESQSLSLATSVKAEYKDDTILSPVIVPLGKTSSVKDAKSTQSKGVKKGNLKLEVEFESSSETYYVVSNAVYQYNSVLYKDNNTKAKVSIWDEDFNLIKTIPNAVTKEYVQVIYGDEPVEIGLLSNRSDDQDKNFFGWYQPLNKKWLLSCKFSQIEKVNHLVLAYAWKDGSKQTVQAYNLSNKKCLQTSSDLGIDTQMVYSYGKYYWFKNGENQYEIYNEDFKWIRTVKYDDSLIYYENGTVRVKKEKVLKSLGIKNPKKACLTLKELCWPKDDATILCNIAPNDSCGYQETDDYIITKDYKEVYHQNIAGVGINKVGNYYMCGSDGDFTDRKVYNLFGKQIMSESGIYANGTVNSENGRNFYGYQDDMLYFFTVEGEEIVSISMEDRNSIDQSIIGQYGKIVLVLDTMKEQFNIFYNDILLLQFNPDELGKYPDVQMIHRKNGDVVIRVNQRLICITDEGKICSDETIDESKQGKILAVLDGAYIVSDKGKYMRYKMSYDR